MSMKRFLFAPRFSLVTMIGAAVLSLGIASASIATVLAGTCVILLGAAAPRNGGRPWA